MKLWPMGNITLTTKSPGIELGNSGSRANEDPDLIWKQNPSNLSYSHLILAYIDLALYFI
jgi:hypothetical protein